MLTLALPPPNTPSVPLITTDHVCVPLQGEASAKLRPWMISRPTRWCRTTASWGPKLALPVQVTVPVSVTLPLVTVAVGSTVTASCGGRRRPAAGVRRDAGGVGRGVGRVLALLERDGRDHRRAGELVVGGRCRPGRCDCRHHDRQKCRRAEPPVRPHATASCALHRDPQ